MLSKIPGAALAIILLSQFSSTVLAAKGDPLIDRNNLSVGGGLSLNSVSGLDNELGYQLQAAYHLDEFNLMQYVDTSIEFGYMDYGDFAGGNSGGLWINAVADGAIDGNLGWLARLGLDLGDDDGVMFGGGMAIYLNKANTLRFEYVIRDNIDSLQVNFLHRL